MNVTVYPETPLAELEALMNDLNVEVIEFTPGTYPNFMRSNVVKPRPDHPLILRAMGEVVLDDEQEEQ